MKGLQILLVIALAIYSAITAAKWKEINNWKKFFVCLSIALALVIGFNTYRENNREDILRKINASFGEISDVEDAVIPTVMLGMTDSAAKFILAQNGVFKFSKIESLFKLYIKDDKLVINIIVRDSLGEPIVAVYKNTWTLYKENYEYNYDDQAIEVVTKGERKVFFHLELRSGKAYLEGVLITSLDDESRNQGLTGIHIFEQGQYSVVVLLGNSFKLNDREKVRPLFKYPAEKYINERETYD